ncbi:MAG: hypothetical protein FJ009_12970 [Chloroflexi bacterium]|nr:hypothetical protein [Chloroflexota bacterium]
MSLLEFLRSLEPRGALAIVLGASIVLYVLAANLAWLQRAPREGRWGRFVHWWQTKWLGRGIGELARWLYYLALPWATLMLGYSTMRALGVWGMDWLAPLVNFGVLALGAAVVIVWVWQPYARIAPPHAVDESGWNWARHLIEVLYREAHWAFYRAGPILWLDDFYWGSFFGLFLILIEGWSNPATRARVEDIARADAALWSGGLAIISALVFIFTQNVWYCLIVHLLLDQAARRAIGFPRRHE